MLSEAVKAVAERSVDRIAEAAEHALPGNIDDDMVILVVRTATDELDTWDKRFTAEPRYPLRFAVDVTDGPFDTFPAEPS